METPMQILEHAIWYQPDHKKYYLVPTDIDWVSGDTELLNLEGISQQVDLSTLEEYENSAAVLEEFLDIAYKKLLQQSQEAFTQLMLFKQLRGEVIDPTTVASALEKVLPAKEADPSLFTATSNDLLKDFDLNTLQKMLPQLHQLASTIDQSVADKKDEPEVWIEVLNQHLFGDLLVSKKEKRKAALKKSINDSIAEGLRKRGISPSADFPSTK